MMTLGVTGAFGFDDFPQPQVLSHYASAGCRILQVYRNRQRSVPASDILAITKDLPLEIDSIHGHFGDDLDPSSEDEAVRRASVELYRREADFCRRLGGSLVVVHPCPANVPPSDLDNRHEQLRKSFAELARIGEQTGVRFAFENMPPYHPLGPDVARLVREVAAAASPHIVFLLDTGHAYMNGRIGDAVRAAGPYLAYTHVHDNDGKNDTHKLPFNGNLPWDECRQALHDIRYDGVFLLEVFEPTPDLPKLLTSDWTRRIERILDNGIT